MDASAMTTQISKLRTMSLAELQEKYAEVFGKETKSRNRTQLFSQIARRLQDNEEPESAKRPVPLPTLIAKFSKTGRGKKVAKADAKAEEKTVAPGVGKEAGEQSEPVADDIIHRIHVLRHASLEDLRAAHEKILGVPTKSRNRQQLYVKLAKHLSEESLRSQPEASVAKPTLTVKFAPKRQGRSKNVTKTAGKKSEGKKTRVKAIGERDSRLPRAGTVLTREWHSKKYLVKVLDGGFEWNGKPFRSLSAVAKAICGQIVNGYLWFNLIPREEKKG